MNWMNEKSVKGMVGALAFAAIAACSAPAQECPPVPAQDANASVTNVASAQAAQAPSTLPAAQPAAAGQAPDYSAMGSRDPFEAYLESEPTGTPPTELEKCNLEEIQMIGAVVGGRDAIATVKCNSGYYSAQRGTRIGKNRGLVMSVRQNEIVVRERFHNETTGKDEFRESIIKM